MRKTVASVVVVFVSLACCLGVLGLAMEYPAGQPVGWCPDWPEGLWGLLNREDRVHGFFVNANDFCFFSGDTSAFNEFLAQYAKLEGTPLTLVLHPGRGLAGSPWDEKKTIPFEWQVNILRRGWDPRAPEATSPEDSEYVVTVELWLGGQVELKKVEVPLNVEVKSSGEIEQFIAAHETRQQAENLQE